MGRKRQLGAIAALALATLLMGACFSPSYQENLPCTASGECPGDLKCISDLCVSAAPAENVDSGTTTPDIDAAAAAESDAASDPVADAMPCLTGSLTIDATASIVDFVVPDCVTLLTIEVFGAEGGGSSGAALLGGKGARMKGDFTVTGGDTLKVLVGAMGADAIPINATFGEQGGGTGGGGSFVVAPDGSAMIVAGGGGGASHNTVQATYLVPGGDAPITSDGIAGDGGGSGGSAGAGGVTYPNTGFHGGTGGGGFLTSGVNNSTGNTGSFGTPNAPGSSFALGGAGGTAGSKGRNGGFGGGGSSGYSGGGGGGYSGGGAGGSPVGATYGGGGGGSLNIGANQDNSPGVQSGDGQVVITW